MNLGINIKTPFSNTRGYLLLCLSSIAIGLSLSKPLMSLGLFGLLIVWLIDGNIKEKVRAFYENKIALIISSIYILTILGLTYTSNFDFALDDLRRKLPIFFLPFFISGFAPLTKKELLLILKIYIGGVLISTFWSLFVSLGGLDVTILDNRDLSRFNSHIRFGLEVALAIFFSFHFLRKALLLKHKILWGIVALWLICSLFLFNLFTGTVVFTIIVGILLVVFGLLSKSKRIKILLILILSAFIINGLLFIKTTHNNFYGATPIEPLKELTHTEDGDEYQINDFTKNCKFKENGYFTRKNIAWLEFSRAWNKKSSIHFEDNDLKGQKIKGTLIRFITSKGLRKDKKAIDSLSEEEVKAIENGIPNYKYLKMDELNIRIHKIIWEYDLYINGGSINGHSVLMRWEYWKTAINIIKNNPLIGVGTGDVHDAFNDQYKKDNSDLVPKYRLRAHSQYLTYGVTFGLIGFIWFLICLFYPIMKTKLYRNFLYLSFFSIVTLSMITEDTLETQVGINYFVFFNALFLLNLKPPKKGSVISKNNPK